MPIFKTEYENEKQSIYELKVYSFLKEKRNFLLFEGEYKEGKKWNGRGKEKIVYPNKILFFNGSYIYGIKIGNGEEYFYNGRMKYYGEYLNDMRNGKGKEFDEKSRLIYEGEFLNN